MVVHKNVKLLAWFNFFTDLRLYSPIAIVYFANVSGSFALGMSVFSITMIFSALFEIPTGVFSDFIGRRKTVILGGVSAVAYSVFYAIGQSFFILAFAAVLEGLSRAFYSGNNDALLHGSLKETKSEHHYDEFLGRISAAFQIALAVSAIIGSILANWSFALIMWISVIPQVVCLLLSFMLKEPKVKTVESGNIYIHLKDGFSQFINNKKLRLLSLSSIITEGLGEAAFHFQAAFYYTIWPLWAIGIAKALSFVTASVSFHLSGRIIRRYGNLKILIFGSLYGRSIGIVAAAFPTILSPLLMSSTSLFYGVASVAKNSLLQKEFRDEQRATMASLNAFAGSIFYAAVAFLLGLAADILSPAKGLLIIQILLIPVIFIYWRLARYKD